MAEFVASEVKESDVFQDLFGGFPSVYRVCLGNRFLKMYRVKGADWFEDAFIKWTDIGALNNIREQCELTRWLVEQGFDTPKPLFEPMVVTAVDEIWEDGVLTGSYYQCHRLLRACDGDLFALGRSLAKLHNALRRYEKRKDWVHRTEQRLKHLIDIRTMAASGKQMFGPYGEELRKLANDSHLDFVRQDLESVYLHGDCNYANAFIGVGKQSAGVVGVSIFDFEDVQHSYLPLEFELAYVIERFVMTRNLDEKKYVTCGKALLEGYSSESEYEWQSDGAEWLHVIQSINLRSLCVLASIEEQGADVPTQEWGKFFYLIERAKDQEILWKKIVL